MPYRFIPPSDCFIIADHVSQHFNRSEFLQRLYERLYQFIPSRVQVCECLLVVMSSSRNVTRMSSSVLHETNGSVPWSSRLHTTLRICTSSTLRDKNERVPRSSRRSSFHLMYVPVVHLRCEFSRRSAKCLLAIEAIKSAPSSSRPR